MQQTIERMSDVELYHRHRELIDHITDGPDVRDELHLVQGELSRREYRAFRRRLVEAD
jgi:hypothetical protein